MKPSPGSNPTESMQSTKFYDYYELELHQRESTKRIREIVVDLKRFSVSVPSIRSKSKPDTLSTVMHKSKLEMLLHANEDINDMSAFMFAPKSISSPIVYQKYINLLLKIRQKNMVGVNSIFHGKFNICNAIQYKTTSLVVNNVHILFKSRIDNQNTINSESTAMDSNNAIIEINHGEITFYPGCYPWELLKEYNLLNTGQKECVKRMICTSDYVLLLGMPGSGKTSMLSLAVRALIAKELTVLISSYTHSAVDNLLLKLIESGVTPDICMRVGGSHSSNETKIAGGEIISRFVFDQSVFNDGSSKPVNNSSTSCVAALAKYLSGIRVAACTVLTASSSRGNILRLLKLDWSIIDEAGQITQPAILGALLIGGSRYFALIGDNYQLPPLVVSPEASSLGLDVSLFRRLAEAHPESIVYLTQQYRMNSDIMELSNSLIYDKRLTCGNESVAKSRLHLPKWDASVNLMNGYLKCIDPSKSVVFINTDGINIIHPLSSSMTNMEEAQLIYKLVQLFKQYGMASHSTATSTLNRLHYMDGLGIISPYKAQVSAIKKYFNDQVENTAIVNDTTDGIGICEISTIDKYQGRDKEIIIISTVKHLTSNNKSVSSALVGTDEIGSDELYTESMEGSAGNLLRDWRRMNVALTRAKVKLIMLGSMTVLNQVPALQALMKIIREK